MSVKAIRTEKLYIRLRPGEKELIEQASRANHMHMAEWARGQLVRSARLDREVTAMLRSRDILAEMEESA